MMTKEGYKKHKKLIEAWSNGAKIQHYYKFHKVWRDEECPVWSEDVEYRLKPFEPKQGDKILVSMDDIVWYERTFISMDKHDTYLCICSSEDGEWLFESYYESKALMIKTWRYAKPLKD